jgi:hypothetical protein
MIFVFCGITDHPDFIEATTGEDAIDDSGDAGAADEDDGDGMASDAVGSTDMFFCS